ncbi:hypothetical protein MKW92_000130 [Papaver armeniacum]|nr:hypothetical protein MKW92_000130 [Papaver armeniacum]
MEIHGALVDNIQVEENLHARTVILNRPHKLNALSSLMVSRLHKIFIACEKDPKVKFVTLRGIGKAFCVGGDVRQTVLDSTGDWKLGAIFLWNLYTLVYRVATFNKPQISRGDRENEAGIGMVPDVGSSFFLSRIPGFFGEYLGLTGARLDGAEMLACGLATHFIPSNKLNLLEEALNQLNTGDPVVISAVIDQFSEQPPLKQNSAYHRQDIIYRCFSQRTVENVISALETESVKAGDAWISEALHLMKKASPLILKVFLKLIRGGRLQGLRQCLAQEYRIASRGFHVGQDSFEVSKQYFN